MGIVEASVFIVLAIFGVDNFHAHASRCFDFETDRSGVIVGGENLFDVLENVHYFGDLNVA